ncbi:MAG TPA: hypothetical protein VKA65_13765 [Acidimicrobiales bacterium]|nr:hypothetical protein [Acidimicrobiales bacterium]
MSDGGLEPAGPTTYLLIDGENLDATLGARILGRRPAPEERPRWDRAVAFVGHQWGGTVKPRFFINASSGTFSMPFVQALMALGLRPVLLSGPPDVKVVDTGLQRTMEAIADRAGDVVLGSHDGDFLPQVQELMAAGRRVGLLAFREFVNTGYLDLVEQGLEIFDLEDEAKAFNHPLPRLRIIDLADFDPTTLL